MGNTVMEIKTLFSEFFAMLPKKVQAQAEE